ncbi:[protein-PII] uridylyltransferase [Thermomonas sp.]|uniref:[protein-PII] uridylyltransferase n=1 Tax=Thermomonas sp. TaxID=1971895 RepID=UPI0026143805|nr:[protein-PII] uridylyltransferase [Thermomonas sp.]
MDALPADPRAVLAGLPAGPEGDAEWSVLVRALLARNDARLARRFDAGDPAELLIRLRARAVDFLVARTWRRCFPDAQALASLALFAVGGYGRGELFPHSDVDLLALAEPEAQQRHQAALSRFVALLWDAGVAASQAVRSAQECTQAADADPTVLTALVEARALAAGNDAGARLRDAIAADKVWPPRAYFEVKREEQQRRHARFGDTADNLEPNLKEGPGGLRDLQQLGWLARRCLGVKSLAGLVTLGHLGADEAAALERERRTLSRLRFGLHLVAGRREERLRFDYQKPLAARLHENDDADTLGVEKLMQSFYRSAAIVQRINERVLQRFEEYFEGHLAPVAIDADWEIRGGYLAARRDGWMRGDPARAFALFAVWAGDPALRGLHSHTARELAEMLDAIPDYANAPEAMRQAFLALLRGPQPVVTLERMARLGVLARWIPAFARVSGRMQFDLFHVFTVDQHTLAVLRNLARFASGEPDERFSIADQVWPSLRKPELLLLAGLFHDIGKGRGGDHSRLGAEDARGFCLAHGLSEADTALVEWLVQKHLLMSTTAQKQDITDPEVIQRFAETVADRQRLDYLYLLTCADIAGTSPKLWNSWKDRLLADLHAATRLALRRGLGQPVAAGERIAENRAAARALLREKGLADAAVDALFARMPEESFLRGRPDQIAWQAAALADAGTRMPVVAVRNPAGRDRLEVFVHTHDRDGVFAAIVITLDRMGLGILHARVLDGPSDTVFDTFQVQSGDARSLPERDAVAARLTQALSGDLDAVRPSRRSHPSHLRHFRVAPQLDFTDIAGGTRIGLICNDRPGLLADIAGILRMQRLRVQDARIATFGERAEDLLLVSDERDAPLPAERREALRDALLALLDGDS